MKVIKKKCKECGQEFTPVRLTTEPVCQQYDCRVAYATKIANKSIAKKDLERKKEKRLEKEKLREKITNWKEELQNEINAIIRFLDYGQKCLARDYMAKQFHAGHVYSRGSNQTIRYNLHNIHRQSAQSNHFQNDDGLLREGLIKEYGQDYMNFISELRRTETLNYNQEDFMDFTMKARKIKNKLKKSQKKFNINQRIELRNEINLELGIYNEEYCVFNKYHL